MSAELDQVPVLMTRTRGEAVARAAPGEVACCFAHATIACVHALLAVTLAQAPRRLRWQQLRYRKGACVCKRGARMLCHITFPAGPRSAPGPHQWSRQKQPVRRVCVLHWLVVRARHVCCLTLAVAAPPPVSADGAAVAAPRPAASAGCFDDFLRADLQQRCAH